MPSSEAPVSPEDAGHQDDDAQDQKNDPNPEPEESPTSHIPAPSIEPANDPDATSIGAPASVLLETAGNGNTPPDQLPATGTTSR
jgi:hypothetical protein